MEGQPVDPKSARIAEIRAQHGVDQATAVLMEMQERKQAAINQHTFPSMAVGESQTATDKGQAKVVNSAVAREANKGGTQVNSGRLTRTQPNRVTPR